MKFPLSSYPGMNRFVLDWLEADERAVGFLPRCPERELRPPGSRRSVPAELVRALEESNRRWGSPVGDELRRWAAGETVGVIAGQQAGFAGGPLYTLAKIASLVRMKRSLAERGVEATIFFWIATEDHDYAEVATLQVPVSTTVQANRGRSGPDLLTLRATRAAASKAMVGPSKIPEPLIAELLALYDLERPSWLREGITFGDSFAELCATAFPGEKIVFVDALLPELRRAGAALFERMLGARKAMQEEIAARSAALAGAGYTPQIVARPGEDYTLLFRIEPRGHRHILDGGAEAGDAASISTSALTRPLLQDFVLAPDVFVGGPAEVAYYAQIAPLHESLGVRLPRVALRGHVLVAPKRVMRSIERFDLGPAELFMPADAILVFREAAGVAEVRAIAREARADLTRDLTRIGEIALPAEHSVARALNRSIGHIEYHFEKLTERAIRGLVRKDRERYAAVRDLSSTLFPDQHVQDRVVGWFSCWRRWGSLLVDRMIEEVEPDSSSFKVIAP